MPVSFPYLQERSPSRFTPLHEPLQPLTCGTRKNLPGVVVERIDFPQKAFIRFRDLLLHDSIDIEDDCAIPLSSGRRLMSEGDDDPVFSVQMCLNSREEWGSRAQSDWGNVVTVSQPVPRVLPGGSHLDAIDIPKSDSGDNR